MSKPTGSGRPKKPTFVVSHPVEHGFTVLTTASRSSAVKAARDALAAAGKEPTPDPIFGDLQKVLPDKKRLNAVFVEWRPHARKEGNRYRACMQLAKPNYGFIDAYAPTANVAIYRLERKLRDRPL